MTDFKSSDGFDTLATWSAIWGAAFIAAWGIHYLLLSLFDVSNGTALAVSAVALFAGVFAILAGVETQPRLKLAFARWRHVAIIGAAFFAGYMAHEYSFSNSREGRSQKAAYQACGQLPGCRSAAQNFGHDVYIPPRR